MIKTILKKSLVLLALAIALTGCKKTVDVDGGKSGDKDPVEEMSPEKKLAYDNYCIYFTSDSEFTLSALYGIWDGTIEYSLDLVDWKVWDASIINSGTDNKIYLRGKGNKSIVNDIDFDYFELKGKDYISCYGNIMTLLDYEKVKNNEVPEMGRFCFANLFQDNDKLITAPDLPATKLTSSCYANMFWNCSSLEKTPKLPATTLADSCYQNMFLGCSSLKEAPELPATNINMFCYQNMFSGCESLEKVQNKLPAEELKDSCYENMFYGCKKLTVAPELPSKTLAENCYASMFSDCTVLKKAPELPATILAKSCYSGMFRNCSSIKTIPDLPSTTLNEDCYKYMFEGCVNVKLYTSKKTDECVEWPCYHSEYSNCYFNMFTQTGGEFTNTPQPGTTYYILRPTEE